MGLSSSTPDSCFGRNVLKDAHSIDHVIHLSTGGRIRGKDLELGVDNATGGGQKYILELATQQSSHPAFRNVHIFTRRFEGLAEEYAVPQEIVNSKLDIVRVCIGPKDYVRKEELYQFGEETFERLSEYLATLLSKDRQLPRIVLHAHYGNAGYFGAKAAEAFGLPLIFTSHSLGRVKQQQEGLRGRLKLLMARAAHAEHKLNDIVGVVAEEATQHMQMIMEKSLKERIHSEECALAQASIITALSQNEIDCQYSKYPTFRKDGAFVLQPGVQLERFYPPPPDFFQEDAVTEMEVTYLSGALLDTARPPVLAIARASANKNLHGLVHAFAHAGLQSTHNLVIVMGTWTSLEEMDWKRRAVFETVFSDVQSCDLKGSAVVLRGKWDNATLMPLLYRWAAARKGVFANPSFRELFGLTTLEAAASGLPVLAGANGGPRDVIGRLKNGVLCEHVGDIDALAQSLKEATESQERWERWSTSGIERVKFFSWKGHVARYLNCLQERIPGYADLPRDDSALEILRGVDSG